MARSIAHITGQTIGSRKFWIVKKFGEESQLIKRNAEPEPVGETDPEILSFYYEKVSKSRGLTLEQYFEVFPDEWAYYREKSYANK